MTPKQGELIDTLTLYSEQCPVLLRQALELEAKDDQRHSPYQRHDQPPPDSSESEAERDPSSSSSEEEDEKETTQAENDKSNTTDTNNNSVNVPSNKPKKPAPTPQQQQFVVKKYVDSLNCNALQINDTEAIHIPTSLLPKTQDRDIAERNYVPPSICQEYLTLSESLQQKTVLVVLLRSGRFAAGIFQRNKCVVHRACQRYTVRKGQGKAQSAQDASRRPKSMGAQLRRAGEENLQLDIQETMQSWKSHLPNVALILLSCPKAMQKYLFEAMDPIQKNDSRIRRLPLDLGRPTYDNVCLAHQVMMAVQLRHWVPPSEAVQEQEPENKSKPTTTEANTTTTTTTTTATKEPEIEFPLTPLHEACQQGDLDTITNMLSNLQQELICLNEHGEGTKLTVEQAVQRRVGPDFMTCLHYAAAAHQAEPEMAANCVSQLLLQGKANPTVVDARHRPPYFVASHDKVREAFRMARATLGEDYCKWDTAAKVGPPLTQDDVQAKKEREAEKRRKKKARQKQKKAEEKQQAEEDRRQQEQAEKSKRQQEEAKRVRDGLQPKPKVEGGTACDFCQKVVKGRKRKDMFSRLEYVYCSAECVQKHKRELMAAAAVARFGS